MRPDGGVRVKTTHEQSFGDSRPEAASRSARTPPTVVGFSSDTSWRTTNREFQYDPNDFVPTPEKKHWDPNFPDGRDPRGEIARRRSRVADPAGMGESCRRRVGGDTEDEHEEGREGPGEADRGRWGGLCRSEAGRRAPREEEDDEGAEKPSDEAGVHPDASKATRRRQRRVTGLWMSSTTSYGMHALDYQLTRPKTDRQARRLR